MVAHSRVQASVLLQAPEHAWHLFWLLIAPWHCCRSQASAQSAAVKRNVGEGAEQAKEGVDDAADTVKDTASDTRYLCNIMLWVATLRYCLALTVCCD